MKVSLASAMGTCFGVQDAINLAMSPEFSNELTIVGQLVHNQQVSESLKQNGVSLVPGIEDIDKIQTKKVMITAHGAAEKTKMRLHDAGFTVYDASCPLVMRVHQTIKSLVKKGYFPVVIGQKDHVEVKGIVGDLDDYLVINSETDSEIVEGIWTSDGLKCVYFKHVKDTDGDIWIYDKNTKAHANLISTEKPEWGPRISPDNKWVAYTGEKDGGEYEIFVISITGGSAEQVSLDGGEELSCSFSAALSLTADSPG